MTAAVEVLPVDPERRKVHWRALRVVIGYETTMWARENGLLENARSTFGLLITVVSAGAAALLFFGFCTAILAVIMPDTVAAVAGPTVLLCQLVVLATALGATSASSRAHAQVSPYRRLYGDALRVPQPYVVFVRGQLLPLVRIAAVTITALILCVLTDPLPTLLPVTLLLSATAMVVVVKIVPVTPGSMRLGAGIVVMAVLGGILLGVTLNALARIWQDPALDLDWFISMSQTLRQTAEFAPLGGIALLIGVGAVAILASRRTEAARSQGRIASTWLSAFLLMTTRGIGRGSVMLLRTAKPLAATVGAFAIAAAIAPEVLVEEPSMAIAIRALPLVVATIVVASLSSFFAPLHVQPMLNLVARSSAGSVNAAIRAYVLVVALWVVPAPLTVAIASAALTGDVSIGLVGLVTSLGAIAGLLLGSLADRFALRLPDGTVELSLWGHTLTGLVPALVTVPAIAWGGWGILSAFGAVVLALTASAFLLTRRVRPL